MKGFDELVLGTPEELDGPRLGRVLRRASPALRVRAARALGELPEAPARARLLELLDDPVPGVRRAAAVGLGWRRDEALGDDLLRALERERCETVGEQLAAAAVRCGRELAQVLPPLEGIVDIRLRSTRGPRSPTATVGLALGNATQSLWQILDPDRRESPPEQAGELPERQELRERLRARFQRDEMGPRGWQALEDLGAQAHPADHAFFVDARRSAGKRAENSILLGLGRNGDPRARAELEHDLSRMDVDPGRGFAYRRLGALALGRLGVPEARRALLRALETEALEHEGRPGAGLGIQYPVRSVILWALGELQLPETAGLLASYLANLHGSAMGGFHLPAMGALYKLGDAAVPSLFGVARGEHLEAAENALGVLEALGRFDELRRVVDDSCPAAPRARQILDEAPKEWSGA